MATEQGRFLAGLRGSSASGPHDHRLPRSETERQAAEREKHLAFYPEDITAEDIADELYSLMSQHMTHRADDPEEQDGDWRIVLEAGGRRFAVTVIEEDPDIR